MCIIFISLIVFTNCFTKYCYSYDLEDYPVPALPDYVIDWGNNDPKDLRKHFIEKKIEKKKVRMLKPANTVSIDTISHYPTNDIFYKLAKALQVQNQFRKLVAMNGVKYTYKRDHHWRTWREIMEADGNKTVVCYRCESVAKPLSFNCHNSGFWVIEENPPCPYELYSMIDSDSLCGANYTKFSNREDLCPSVIKFSELTGSCDNPIETTWRFTKLYNKTISTKRNSDFICGNRNFCEVYTIYAIYPDQVVFRLINGTNHVIYSRVMKANHTNYVCVDDCGVIDRRTLKVRPNDNPTSIDLNPNHINKRENQNNIQNISNSTTLPLSVVKKIVVVDTKKPESRIMIKTKFPSNKLKHKIDIGRAGRDNGEIFGGYQEKIHYINKEDLKAKDVTCDQIEMENNAEDEYEENEENYF